MEYEIAYNLCVTTEAKPQNLLVFLDLEILNFRNLGAITIDDQLLLINDNW